MPDLHYPRPTATLVTATASVTSTDMSALASADWTGESTVTFAGVTWTLENAANMTTMGPDGSTGLVLTQDPDTGATGATSSGGVEVRARRNTIAADDDLGAIAIGFRFDAVPSGGTISAFVRDAALAASNPDIIRMQTGDIGVNDYRCQSITGGTATTISSGTGSLRQIMLVVIGHWAATYYSTGTTEPDDAALESMFVGTAPSGWTLCSEGEVNIDTLRDADAWVGLNISGGVTASTTIDRWYTGTREASVS